MNLLLPNLNIFLTEPIPVAYGSMWGAGSGLYSMPQYSLVSHGTTFVIRRKEWNGTPGDYAALRSSNWGAEGVYSYHESFGLHNFRIIGGADHYNDPEVKESGIQIWRAGEQSRIEEVFVSRCNDYGIEFAGGNHATGYLRNISSFTHGLGAVAIIGGGQVIADLISSDDCPAQFVIKPNAKGSIGNGTKLYVRGTKMETGPAPTRPTGKGMMLLEAEGWFQAHFVGVMYSRVVQLPECFMRLKADPRMPSKVTVEGFMDFYLPRSIIHDRNTKQRHQFGGEFASTISSIKWTSAGELSIDGPFRTIENTCDNRLAPIPLDPMTGKPKDVWDLSLIHI